MKNLYLLLITSVLLFTQHLSFAQTKTAVLNGNWNDSLIWSPAGVPYLEDTVIIDANVEITNLYLVCPNCIDLIINQGKTLTNNLPGNIPLTVVSGLVTNNGTFISNQDVIFGNSIKNNGEIIINSSIFVGNYVLNNNIITVQNIFDADSVENHRLIYSDSLVTSSSVNYDSIICTSLVVFGDNSINHNYIKCNEFVGGDYMNNHDSIICTGLVIFGDSSTNYDYISCDKFVSEGNMSNYGHIITVGDFVTGGAFIQHTNSIIECGDSLDIRGLFDNYSQVITTNLLNSDHITGIDGKFCISDNYINFSLIDGNIDICDATPNSATDSNYGTIASTVTNCSVGPCGVKDGLNFSEHTSIKLVIYPNPAYNQLNILSEAAITKVDLYNNVGKLVLSSKTTSIDISSLTSGIYIVVVNSSLENKMYRFVKI